MKFDSFSGITGETFGLLLRLICGGMNSSERSWEENAEGSKTRKETSSSC